MQLFLICLCHMFILITSTEEEKFQYIPSNEECGEVAIATRVIGGKPAKYGRFPWLVSVGRPSYGTFVHNCGGTLITRKHALTAAHCFGDALISHIRVGEYDIASEYDGAQHRDYAILKHINPGYDDKTFENDISLVYLVTSVEFNDYVKPGCLPFNLRSEPFHNGKVRLVGWGRRSTTTTVGAKIPFTAEIPLLTMSRCTRTYRYDGFKLDNRQLCYGTKGLASCRGDSGSPLMIMDKSLNKLVVVGLPSVGACGVDYKPSFATKITEFLDWIIENVETN